MLVKRLTNWIKLFLEIYTLRRRHMTHIIFVRVKKKSCRILRDSNASTFLFLEINLKLDKIIDKMSFLLKLITDN